MMKALGKRITTSAQRQAVRDVIARGTLVARGLLARKSQPQVRPFADRFGSFSPPYRLPPGCGNGRLRSFCSVDRLADGCVQEIYTCHVLEHFAHDDVEPLLRQCVPC